MSLFSGSGARPGVAIAAAARLRVEYGVASFDPERLRRIAARLRAFGVESPEPEQIILIAETLPPGLLAATAGLEIVGIALGSEAPLAVTPDCPTVIGLGGEFFESVQEEEIVIVDGSRGRVYTSPDATTLSRYQSPSVSARRIFLDEPHLPARTMSDGRQVTVFAAAGTESTVSQAISAGADGLFVDADNQILGSPDAPMTASEQTASLAAIMPILGGLPLLISLPPECLALSVLARASARGPLHLIVDDAAVQDEIRARMAEIEAMLEEEDDTFGTLQFELALQVMSEAALPDSLSGFAGVFVTGEFQRANMERLLPIAALTRRNRCSLMLALGSDWSEELSIALSLGANRLLVPVSAIQDVKDAVRAW